MKFKNKNSITETTILFNMNQCTYCNKLTKDPWIEYTNNKGDHCKLCSYLCNKKLDSNYSWDNVINKDDFKEYMLFPTYLLKNKQEFHMLSNKELNKLSKNKLENYYKQLDHFKMNDYERYNIISSIINDTNYIDDYENELLIDNEEDTIVDDY